MGTTEDGITVGTVVGLVIQLQPMDGIMAGGHMDMDGTVTDMAGIMAGITVGTTMGMVGIMVGTALTIITMGTTEDFETGTGTGIGIEELFQVVITQEAMV